MATAIHEFKRNPEAAIKMSQKFLEVKNEANAKAAYEAYIKVYPDDLRPSLKGIALVIAELAKTNPKAATTKPQDLVDTGVLDELTREGFFDKLPAQN
jgi:hypothetical protein